MRHGFVVCNRKIFKVWSCLLAALMLIIMAVGMTSCGSAGGRRASDWSGTWYREGGTCP